MSGKKDAAEEAAANQATRPAMYAFGAIVVVCVAAAIVNGAAPDVFDAVGGWFTVLGIVFVVAVWSGLSMVRRVNRNAARAQDKSRGR